MREDIAGGLKNAMERGASLEQAIQSFINAGYRDSEVRETARLINTSTINLTQPSSVAQSQFQGQTSQLPRPVQPQSVQPSRPTTLPIRRPMPAIAQVQQNPAYFEVRHQSGGTNWLIIVLSVILLMSIVAFVASLLFKTEIANFLSSMF